MKCLVSLYPLYWFFLKSNACHFFHLKKGDRVGKRESEKILDEEIEVWINLCRHLRSLFTHNQTGPKPHRHKGHSL